MMRPHCWGIMYRRARRVPQNVAFRFQLMAVVPRLVAHVDARREVARATGVVHEDVDAAEALDGGVDEALDVGLLR